MRELDWWKSSFSSGDGNTNCVEIAAGPRTLRMRESEQPATVIAPTSTALAGLLRHLKAGEARPR